MTIDDVTFLIIIAPTSGEDKPIRFSNGRALGEAVFIPRPGRNEEDNGWIVMRGYDVKRNENYLEIRDAGTLDFEARIWTGGHFPLGFHGNFHPAV